MLRKLMRKKAMEHAFHDTELHRSLTALDLTLFGIGAIIGAGVFVLTGIAAATKAGPAIVISYCIAGLAAMFAALAYAELASSIGGTGSAYSYAYAGFGEFIAWLIGWNLLLEYAMSVATVAIGWSGYVSDLFKSINMPIPIAVAKNPFEGGVVNLLAIFIILLLSALLIIGVKHSARVNTIAVIIKLLTILLFVIFAVHDVDVTNWANFFPFGWSGVMAGAALVFFAYIGFDALSTTVEESIHPQRDIPLSIILSLIICTFIYILVSILLTGIAPYNTLNVRSPVSEALLRLGHHIAAGFVAAGAIAGLTTVMLVMFYGLTRIILAIARDGLIPISIAKIHPQTRTPISIISITGILIACVAGFAPIDRAAELVNIGTLTAFSFVCGGVILFRFSHPDIHRPFKSPFSPYVPLLGVFFCLYLMFNLPMITWERFIIWTIIGIGIYFLYGVKNSKLQMQKQSQERE